MLNAAGQTTSYSYDAAGELTALAYSDGVTPAVSYAYDANGRRSSMTDGTGTSSYFYDLAGELTSATNGAGQNVGYVYDLRGELTALRYPDGRVVTRSYDPAGRMTSLADGAGYYTSFGYDPAGHLTSISYPDTVTENVSYDPAGNLTALADTGRASGGTTVTLASYAYTRDPNGQLTAATTPTPPAATPAPPQTFSYSPQNQLASWTAGVTGTYAYDPAGNLTALANGTTQRYNAADELTSSTSPAGAQATYAYSPTGDRSGASIAGVAVASYGYDQADRLTNANVAGVAAGRYSYDGDGLRATSTTTVAGTTVGPVTAHFAYDQAEGLPLILTDGTTDYIYGPGGLATEELSKESGAYVDTFFGHDQQGSTRLLFDPFGQVVGTYAYSPYGATLAHTGLATALQYDGGYADPTGLYWLRARYYDPATGTFLTRDPLEALTGSPYGYAGGSPLNVADLSGLTSYSYWFDLGPYGTPQELAAYARDNCAELFPIAGCVSLFDVGQVMHLHQPYFWLYTQSFPVRVTSVTSTSFSFISLNGHPEGRGRTITFDFCRGANGDTMLNVQTSSNGSTLTNWWGIRDADFWLAHRTWANFAASIEANYYFNMVLGGPPVSLPTWL
ncbi:MAG: RHS repeat-associated core domain-containing protein [Mycobacteriales bacterium]